MKMLHECRATHILWVNWVVEFDGDINLMFCLRECQCQVKLCQIRSNFKTKNFLTKSCLSCPALPQDHTNVIYFYVYVN